MMNIDPKALRLYAIVMLPVAIAAAWFVFRYEKSPASVPILPGSVAVTVGGRTFSAEVADTPASRELGLGLRDSLCSDCAMLFRFDAPGIYPFWMKGMRFPLDLAWIRDGKVVFIEKNIPADSTAIMTPDAEAFEVIETNAGALSDVREGDAVVVIR
ncbi:MAG: DUF192 domain-containing protein [Candidatus Moraniibacteriota bacterium]